MDGQSLEDYLQQFVAGVSYLDGTLVRPRWQEEPPNLPAFDDVPCWCAVGIVRRRPIGVYAAVVHYGDNDGYSDMQRHEDLDVLCSFYGAGADEFATNLHNGLMLWQNTSILRMSGLAFVEIGEGVRAPELIKEKWLNRIDKWLMLRRVVQRYYPVLNILSIQGTVNAETYQTSWQGTLPP
jgi:hypothetical protein